MLRKIIKIEKDKCNGCGLCAEACHEGAIGLIDGKAKLLRDDYCDGLGDCLPVCPTGAITFETREAAEYDEIAVNRRRQNKEFPATGGCPGARAQALRQDTHTAESSAATAQQSELRQWPVQIKLAPVNAPYYDGANLLIAADCAAYAHGNFHEAYMRNRITLIGCPKLDMTDYSEKLTTILRQNRIKSVTVARMEVPCCRGIEQAVVTALQNSGRMIPWQVVTISTSGLILDD